jgi:ParB family chromosome partitioning protein
MAARLNVKDAWLSKYLRLADLPKLIVAAFPDLLSIKTNYAAVLLPLLKEAKSKKRVLEVARNFTRKKTAGEQYSVADLMKAFKGSAVKSGRSGSVQRYQARNKSHPVLLKSATSRRLSIEIDRSAGVGRKEIVELLDKALKDHF